MEATHTRRLGQPTAAIRQPSPRLMRCRSEAPVISLPENNTLNTSKRFVNRSKSTTKSRINTKRNEENLNPSTATTTSNSISIQKKAQESSAKDGFVRFLQRGSPRNYSATKVVKSGTTSPSAWVLSPGRSSPCVAPPESPVSGEARVKRSGGGGGVSGVLKYFKQKKVLPVQEEEYHRFRVFNDRLLQWRFVNARAEAAMVSMKITAEESLFCMWLRIFKMRNFIMEERIEVRKLKHEIKLYQIISTQIPLLNEWAKLDGKNLEATGRMTRKLSALSVRLPLVQGAKGDVMSIYEAMNMAIGVMDSIEAIITKFLSKVEKILYLLTEFTSMMEQQKECFDEVENTIALVPKLVARENSLRVHLIQAAKEYMTDQGH